MKKLAIFDLDGTLYDTREVNYLSYQKALREVGYDVDRDFFYEKCNGYHYKTFLPIVMSDLQGEEHAETLAAKMEAVHVIKKASYASFLGHALENTFLFDMIESMKETYHMALVTTASRKNTEEILEYTGRKELFDLILCQEDVSKKKPDPEGFLKAIEYFDANPEDTVIFEDSDVGIQAALASGAKVVQICKF